MIKFFQEISAKLRLNTWDFNYPVDPILETLLASCIISGILNIDLSNSCYLNVTFNDGTNLRAWNANKYYGWLGMGKIGFYSWNDGRPTASTMLELRRIVIEYQKELLDPIKHAKNILAKCEREATIKNEIRFRKF